MPTCPCPLKLLKVISKIWDIYTYTWSFLGGFGRDTLVVYVLYVEELVGGEVRWLGRSFMAVGFLTMAY